MSNETSTSLRELPGGGTSVALLCAAPHDDISNFLSTLLDGFPDLGMHSNVFKVEEPIAYRKIVESLSLREGTDILLVFAGHGAEYALLGPPDRGGGMPSHFYDDDDFESGPPMLIAFCCSAGAGIGEYFRRFSDRAFLGFKSPIGFVTEVGIYTEHWRKILHDSTLRVIESDDTELLDEYVRKLYQDAYRYFDSNDGQQLEWAFWMKLMLRGHLDALLVSASKQRFGTSA